MLRQFKLWDQSISLHRKTSLPPKTIAGQTHLTKKIYLKIVLYTFSTIFIAYLMFVFSEKWMPRSQNTVSACSHTCYFLNIIIATIFWFLLGNLLLAHVYAFHDQLIVEAKMKSESNPNARLQAWRGKPFRQATFRPLIRAARLLPSLRAMKSVKYNTVRPSNRYLFTETK